jgi:hypothetical protein
MEVKKLSFGQKCLLKTLNPGVNWLKGGRSGGFASSVKLLLPLGYENLLGDKYREFGIDFRKKSSVSTLSIGLKFLHLESTRYFLTVHRSIPET